MSTDIQRENASIKMEKKYVKVYPTNKSSLDSAKMNTDHNLKVLCTCKILSVSFMLARMFGMFPYTWKDDNNQCVYYKSNIWFFYSIFIVVIPIIPWYLTKGFSVLSNETTPEFLFHMTYFINAIYVLVLIINLIKHKDFRKSIKKLNKLNLNYLFCKQSKLTAKRLGYKVSFCFCGIVLLQVIAFVIWKIFYPEHLLGNILFLSIFHILPFVVSNMWIVVIKYFICMFVCFESTTINYLNYQPPHPLETINFRHNVAFFYGFNKYTICHGKHYMPQELKALPKYQLIEYLRIFHEKLYQCCLEILNNTGLQFLIHIVFEILILTVSWFLWVVYVVKSIPDSPTKALFTWNFLYLFWHTTTLYWILKNYHDLKKIIRGLKIILIESTVRCETIKEYQQIRLFLDKMENQVTFTAKDFFEIDLKIIGPIAGSIITYILVALQSGVIQ